jgi:hypothetical protein
MFKKEEDLTPFQVELELLCIRRHNISSYPSFIFYPRDDPKSFYELEYDIKPYLSHFRVLKQYTLDSQKDSHDFILEANPIGSYKNS